MRRFMQRGVPGMSAVHSAHLFTTCICAGAVLVAEDKERRSQELKFKKYLL